MKRIWIVLFLIFLQINVFSGFSWALNLAQEAFDGNMENVQFLLDKGTDPNTSLEGQTALMLASYKGYTDIVKALIEKRADVNIKRQDNNATALHAAVMGKNAEIVSILLQKGAKVDIKAKDGTTPLMLAAMSSGEEIAGMLLKKTKGAQINAQNNNGFTAVMFAAQNGNLPVLKLLIESGADLNKKNARGLSAFGIANMRSSDAANQIALHLLGEPENTAVSNKLDKNLGMIAQAVPINNLLLSAKEDDLALFKTVFSPRIRIGFEREGWQESLEGYKKNFEKEFGDFSMNDFEYEFNGNEDFGKVVVKFKGETKGALKVWREYSLWKMDEK